MALPILVHISADFPDPISTSKTRAISNLIDGTPGYRHVIYSLNRVSGWSGIEALRFDTDRVAVAFGALPRGLFLAKRMRELAQWIIADLADHEVRPCLVHAHKLSIEGLVGDPVARAFDAPLMCSIQANTDAVVLAVRPDLRRRYRDLWRNALHVFPFSPAGKAAAERMLGPREGPTTLLPCITAQDQLRPAAKAPRPRILSIFRLDVHEHKNAGPLVKATVAAAARYPELTLDIYGTGSAASFFELARMIRRVDGGRRVRLMGSIPHGLVQDTIGRYSAFAMPTQRESYGMVFAESLMAGVPILHTRGWGLHGLYADDDIGYACRNPRSIQDVAQGICHLIANEERLKGRIAAMQRAGALDLLRQDAILATYRSALQAAAGNRARAPEPAH